MSRVVNGVTIIVMRTISWNPMPTISVVRSRFLIHPSPRSSHSTPANFASLGSAVVLIMFLRLSVAPIQSNSKQCPTT